jgi:excisionase family DNA binding protein
MQRQRLPMNKGEVKEHYPLYTIKAASQYLNLSESSIRAMVKKGHLTAIPIRGYSYAITIESLNEWKGGVHKRGPALRLTELESWCTTCKKFKLKHDFHKNHRRSTGLANQCKTCVKNSRRKRNGTQPENFRTK